MVSTTSRPTSTVASERLPGFHSILLVGHSYGGAVITAAGNDDRVAGLVYISALRPDEDETLQGEQGKPETNGLSQSMSWTAASGCSLKASSTSPGT